MKRNKEEREMASKANYASETVIPFYITGGSENSESAVVAKPPGRISAIYFLSIAGDIKKYGSLRIVVSLVSGSLYDLSFSFLILDPNFLNCLAISSNSFCIKWHDISQFSELK